MASSSRNTERSTRRNRKATGLYMSEIMGCKESPRRKATMRERKRMHRISEAMDDLRQVLPSLPHDKKPTKLKTLQLARFYIVALRSAIQKNQNVIGSGNLEPVTFKMTEVTSTQEGDAQNVIPSTSESSALVNENYSYSVATQTDENTILFPMSPMNTGNAILSISGSSIEVNQNNYFSSAPAHADNNSNYFPMSPMYTGNADLTDDELLQLLS